MNESSERLLLDWLSEGPERGPAYGIERALAATRRTPQRPGWTIPERWLPMQLAMRPAGVPRPMILLAAVALLAVALAGVMVFVGSQRPAPPPPFGPAGNGLILTGVGTELWLANADGTHSHQLEIGLGQAVSPIYSPDGTKVAFMTRAADRTPYSLFVANADGSGAGMTWSPDSSKIVFMSSDAGTNRLYRVGLDGGDPQPITGRDADRKYPAWSPDGQWLAYKLTAGDAASTSLAIARPDGTGERLLVSEPGALAAFSGSGWTNDSGRLVYFRTSPSGHAVAVVDLAGNETLLSKPLEDAANPVISPDGRRVAFGL
jgi:Tol biopolymer transport system component